MSAPDDLLRWFERTALRLGAEVELGTIDNPGWWLVVRVPGQVVTALEGTDDYESEERWLHWTVTASDSASEFVAHCGLRGLKRAIEAWRAALVPEAAPLPESAALGDLVRWTEHACDGDWEHGSGIQITHKDVDPPVWLMTVERAGLAVSEPVALARTIANDEGDAWRFAAPSLSELLSVFRAAAC